MQASRRSFIAGLLAAGTIAIATTTGLDRHVLELVRDKTVLFGDGITNDTAAIQAFLDGGEVIDGWTGRVLSELPPRRFVISETLRMKRGTHQPSVPCYLFSTTRGNP